MKLAVAFASALALGLIGAFALWLVPPGSEPVAAWKVERPEPVPDSGAAASGELALLDAEVDMLEDRMSDLEGELELLRTAIERRPAEPAIGAAAELAASASGRREFTDAERAEMAAILARAREEEVERRAAERAARAEELVLARARSIASELALPAADEALLALHLREEAERREALLARWREGDADREALGLEFVALRDWSDRHLEGAFGAELAEQIRRAERWRRGQAPGEPEAPSDAPRGD